MADLEPVIINENDIRQFYPQLSVNIAKEKINASILKAQQTDLERFLGVYLYADFIEDYQGQYVFSNPVYQTLFDGSKYTYRSYNRYQRGVRQLLAVYAFARLMNVSDINVTESGNTRHVTEESELTPNPDNRHDIAMVKDDAIGLEANIKVFIETNRTDYPLYDKVYSTETNRTSFNFHRI